MSEIRANTISDAAGTGPIDLHKQSAAKAWVSFIGTTVGIRNSLNTSSITDNGTGSFNVNFSTSFAANTYAPSCTTWQSTSATGVSENFQNPLVSTQNLTTTENNAAADPNHVNLAFHGDLA